jgi:hypothetical protein
MLGWVGVLGTTGDTGLAGTVDLGANVVVTCRVFFAVVRWVDSEEIGIEAVGVLLSSPQGSVIIIYTENQ